MGFFGGGGGLSCFVCYLQVTSKLWTLSCQSLFTSAVEMPGVKCPRLFTLEENMKLTSDQ